MKDPSKESLYKFNSQGDTALLLQAVKQETDEEIIRLLIRYDTSQQSLLMPSQKRHKIPLCYVAHKFLENRGIPLCRDDEFLEKVPEDLAFFLLQTHRAIILLQQRKDEAPANITSDEYSYEEDNDSESELDNGPFYQDVIHLIEAAFACGHWMESHHTQIFCSMILQEEALFAKYRHGNTLLHLVCEAPFDISRYVMGMALLEELFHKYPQAVTTTNDFGKLPLHLAIKRKRPWIGSLELPLITPKRPWRGLLERLIDASPESVSIPTPERSLPLHLAIQNYPCQSTERQALWKCYPKAATVRDASGLYPFQLAALPNTDWENTRQVQDVVSLEGETREHGKKQLTDVFLFLRAFPEVL